MELTPVPDCAPFTCCWGNASKAMSKGGSWGETCCGAQNGMRGNQGSGARFPQRETKRKQTKGRDRSKQASQTGPLHCKNRAFTKLREGREPGVKHSLCNSVEELLTEYTQREKPHMFTESNIYFSSNAFRHSMHSEMYLNLCMHVDSEPHKPERYPPFHR